MWERNLGWSGDGILEVVDKLGKKNNAKAAGDTFPIFVLVMVFLCGR